MVLLACLAGCEVVDRADTAVVTADTTNTAVVNTDTVGTPADSQNAVLDSAAIPAPAIVVPIQRPPDKPVLNDTLTTPADLTLLGAALDVPVQGVGRSQLRDTYAEPRGARVHEALDILAARGTPVLSATDGRLLKLFDSKAGGLMVYATDASERFILLYGHLDSYGSGLTNGMRLTRGQVIGYVGTTGNAPPGTPHLHFGILRGQPSVSWSKGAPLNPYTLLIRGSEKN